MVTKDTKYCQQLLSSFVDTFVDFCVSDGLFLPPEPKPSINNIKHHNSICFFPSPERLIALGDLHGDLLKTKQSLSIAGLIDVNDTWSGGSSTLVQVGDVLDRGDGELKILYFLEKLRWQAKKAGGNVITLNGNHEIMNVGRDFRCVSRGGLDEFKNWAYWFGIGNSIKRRFCDHGLKKPDENNLFDGIPLGFDGVKDEDVESIRARIAALRPKGPIATRFLSKNLTVAVVGESVFVHGGVLPDHVAYGLERINREVKEWISGLRVSVTSSLISGKRSLVHLRKFSKGMIIDSDRDTLEFVLTTIPGARRMIMGHTIQEGGINGACDNRAIRIDVGMSKGCKDGLPEVLEISDGSRVRVLTSNPMMYQSVDLLTPVHGQLNHFRGAKRRKIGRPSCVVL